MEHTLDHVLALGPVVKVDGGVCGRPDDKVGRPRPHLVDLVQQVGILHLGHYDPQVRVLNDVV